MNGDGRSQIPSLSTPPIAGAVEGTHPIRKRMKRCEVPGGVRFITFSCEHRLPLLGTPESCDLFARSLREGREKLGFRLLAWVAMPEHVHLLMIPPEGCTLAPVLKSIKLSMQQRIVRVLRLSGDPLALRLIRADGSTRFWQKGGGFDRNVRSDTELCKEIRYIHRNPVARGLVAAPDEWRWSSARWWSARHRGIEQDAHDVPCDWPPGDPRAWVMWEKFA
ncbi:MAG: transposase [Phycisphaeraceae bacterium]|nr:transposase [Phycisphaeraceae bacterium]MBX3407483.1 transposase [Phycisphaeraceae bacterium]